MLPSKAVQRMIKEHKPTAAGGGGEGTVPPDYSFAARNHNNNNGTSDISGSGARGRGAVPSVTGFLPPRNPKGTTAPPSFLPVRPQRLPGDTVSGTASSSPIPLGAGLDEELQPHAAARLAANNQLATRATRTDASETVVRSSESPLLLGPVATAAPRNTVTLRGTAGGSPAPSQRPPSRPLLPGPMTPKPSTAADAPAEGELPAVARHHPSATESTTSPDFASELAAIGLAHAAELAAAAKGRHRAALAQAAALRQALSGRSPPPPASGSPAVGKSADETFRPEDFEAVDGSGPQQLSRRLDDDPDEDGRTATGKPLHVLYTPDIRARLPPGTTAHSMLPSNAPLGIADYKLLAEACQRAGRARTEAHAYYKIGEILSGVKETRAQSIPYFKRYLNLARRLNDLQGEAKALNCLGVVYHELGGDANWRTAIEYHQQHAAIADAAGVFVANTNLGLAYNKLGDPAAALKAFKTTLKYAVRAGDRVAEALALANLARAGAAAGDVATARVCVERNLELSTALHDAVASCEAHEQLGTLALQRGDHAAATRYLTLALESALADGDQSKARVLRCQIGIAQGLAQATQALEARAVEMGAESSAM